MLQVTIYDVAMSVLVNTRLNVLSSVLSVATKKEGIIYVFSCFTDILAHLLSK